MGLDNLWVMIPFVRTLDEGRKVIEVLAKHGLKRGEDGLRIIMMCEVPSNALLADEFLDIFDGFSIGSNDLTQLTLGLDRDSSIVASLFDERDPAVKKLLAMAIKTARSEEHTSELQSLMRISYAVFCLKKKKAKLSIQMNKIQI